MSELGQSLGKLAFSKLLKNKPAIFGVFCIVLAIVIAIGGANFRKDKTPMANEMLLPISAKNPGFSVTMLKVKKNKEIDEGSFFSRLFFGGTENPLQFIPISSYRISNDQLIYREFSEENSEELPEIAIPLTDVVYGIEAYQTSNGSTTYTDSKGVLQSIDTKTLQQDAINNHISTEKYVLGTDKYGRDLLSRLFAGTIISLSVGLIAVIISLLVGIFMGAIAGYYRGRVDDVITWFINVIWSIPTLLLVISITLILGKGFSQIFIAVGLTMWVEVARITRGQFITLREKEFVEAAKALGYKPFRIIFKHILPNAWSPLIVISASNFANAILIEAGLSFLGVGAQPPMPSWGNMIKEHYGYIVLNKAYLALAPGCAIMILVLAFTLLGNGLRDALDTRSTN